MHSFQFQANLCLTIHSGVHISIHTDQLISLYWSLITINVVISDQYKLKFLDNLNVCFNVSNHKRQQYV